MEEKYKGTNLGKPLPDHMNHECLEVGKRIWIVLRKEYPGIDGRTADFIFNSIIAALLCFRSSFANHDHETFKWLVNKVLDNSKEG